MSISLKAFKSICFDQCPVDGLIVHNGRALTDSETRILVNYGIDKGYKTLTVIPKEIVDEICETRGNAEWMQQYNDAPQYIALPYLERILQKLSGFSCNDWDGDDIFRQITDEI